MRYFFIITALLTVLSNPAQSALVTFKYDQAGNMISEQGKYYEYNDANQLVRVRKDSPTGEIIAEYVYDYQGQRVKKIENGVTTYYIGKHYEERKGKTVDEKTSYFFANSQRIAKSSQKNKAPPEVSYYLNNHLGSADVIIDEQGTQTDRIRYLPFGGYRTLPQERHTFTGKERDEVTDNYYFEARYYNPNIRRFTQADTIIPDLYDPQSLNRYAYVQNNPLNFTDPTGHNKLTSWLLGQSRRVVTKVKPYAPVARDKIKEYASKSWSGTKSVATKGWNSAKSAADRGRNSTKSAASRGWNSTKSVASSGWDNAKSLGRKGIDGIKNKVKNLSIKNVGKEVAKDIAVEYAVDKVSTALLGEEEDIPYVKDILLMHPYGIPLYIFLKPKAAGGADADVPYDGSNDMNCLDQK